MSAGIPTLQDFDFRRRAVSEIAGDWTNDVDATRQLWKFEDLIFQQVAGGLIARQLIDYFRLHGNFPNPETQYSQLIDMAEDWAATSQLLLETAERMTREGIKVAGIQHLSECAAAIQDAIREDRFARDASFGGEAFVDWE